MLRKTQPDRRHPRLLTTALATAAAAIALLAGPASADSRTGPKIDVPLESDLFGWHINRGPVTDTTIRKNIEREFFWSPIVDGDQIKVRVKNGVATLTGSAATYREKNAATQNGYDGGARKVVNRIAVRGD